ncbi:TMEM175 family protein [Streptomyces sp. GC420]|uniref:TMEM175 family protein n=1 Tax=Streptomyces sp. GC420 TaxID=2697568 RepID=UPI00141530C8|nr:TMEM175 family protein [Streptomyces sp. GC420]NBM19260.1 DUF1211 domain-containing protein [Streptomyces sp. GC420]
MPAVSARSTVVVKPDRLLAFGDAVFAIAITLLALDIGVPEGLDPSRLGEALRDALPDVRAYLLSFAVIGVLWVTQHAAFSFIARVDGWVLLSYMCLLAVVAALPFPTRLISDYGDTALATTLYAATISAAAAFMAALQTRLLLAPELARRGVARSDIRHSLWQSLAVVTVFATSVPLTAVSAATAQYWWILAVPVRRVLARRAAR